MRPQTLVHPWPQRAGAPPPPLPADWGEDMSLAENHSSGGRSGKSGFSHGDATQSPDGVRCPRCWRALWWPEPTPAGRSARSPGGPGAARSEGCGALRLPRAGQAGRGAEAFMKPSSVGPMQVVGHSPRVSRYSCPVGLGPAPSGGLWPSAAPSPPPPPRRARSGYSERWAPGRLSLVGSPRPHPGLHCSRHRNRSTPFESFRESGFLSLRLSGARRTSEVKFSPRIVRAQRGAGTCSESCPGQPTRPGSSRRDYSAWGSEGPWPSRDPGGVIEPEGIWPAPRGGPPSPLCVRLALNPSLSGAGPRRSLLSCPHKANRRAGQR